MIRFMVASDGVVPTPSLNGGAITDSRFAPTFAEAKVTFGTDGSITQYTTLGGSEAYGAGWYAANTTGIGSYFWLRLTINAGSGLAESSNIGTPGSTWNALSTARFFSVAWNSTVAGGGTYNITVDIASDSGGTNIVSSCTFDLTAAST